MSFWGDYHTHTTYSHGKGSVLDNAKVAADKGLKELAITDHGLRHMVFGIHRKELPELRRDCEKATELTGVRVLAGIENNLNSFDGTFDLTTDDLEILDIVQGGYHKTVWSTDFAQQFTFQLRNLFCGNSKHPSAKLVAKNTDSYLKLIENYELDFVGHLNRDICADAVTVARFAKEKGTFIELNSKRFTLTDRELEKMTEEGVVFICNSDAHRPERVGDMSTALAVIERLHIPYEQIANWEKLPSFRSRNSRRFRARYDGGDAK